MRLLVLLLFVLIIAGGALAAAEQECRSDGTCATSPNRPTRFTIIPQNLWRSPSKITLRAVSDPKRKPPEDLIGVISFQESALIDAVPASKLALDTRAIRPPGKGTDRRIGGSTRAGDAPPRRDAPHAADLGRQPDGRDLETALAQASAQHVPIDVMPLKYDVQSEVLVERFVAPTWKRENDPFTIEVILRSTNATDTTGKLTVLHNGQPMDLDPATPGVQSTRLVTLKPGRNVERISVPALEGSNVIHNFHATFEGENVTSIINPQAPHPNPARRRSLVTRSSEQHRRRVHLRARQGKILTSTTSRTDAARSSATRSWPRASRSMTSAPASTSSRESRRAPELRRGHPRQRPARRGRHGEDQQRMLASYVHDMGGGLVMIGGEDAFGAGGWQGSKLEEVLPVNMDVPAQRQMPKGALVLIMHSCEMPDGNYWGEQCALKAVETLSARDEIGVISYDWEGAQPDWARRRGGRSQWDFPLQEKGDGSKVTARSRTCSWATCPASTTRWTSRSTASTASAD
jgi:hypothetical protein